MKNTVKYIKVCLDDISYASKPSGEIMPAISNRIAKKDKIKHLNSENFIRFAADVGLNGQAFCPATFYNGIKDKENFEQVQMFVLDFDDKDRHISFKEVQVRAEQYDLPIKFAYHTYNRSPQKEKFRVILLHETSVTDIRVAEIIHGALLKIFPEADKACSVVQMYFGNFIAFDGGLLYYSESMRTFDIETLIRSMTHHLRETFGDTNYKRKIAEFGRKHGIALDRKGFLDITREEISDADDADTNPINITNKSHLTKSETEGLDGASLNRNHVSDDLFGNISTNLSDSTSLSNDRSNDNKLPKPFIIVKGFGSNLLNHHQYRINLNDDDSNGTDDGYVENSSDVNSSAGNSSDEKNPDGNNTSENIFKKKRNPHRSDVIGEIGSVCRLYLEFENGRKPSHHILLGLATNLIQIESGDTRFFEIIKNNSYFKDRKWKYASWAKDLKYFRVREYKAQSCNSFCPYVNECTHGSNIITTVRPKFPMRIADYVEELAPIEEVEKELEIALDRALGISANSSTGITYALGNTSVKINRSESRGTNGNKLTVICAQTAIGKSRAFVKRMDDLGLVVAAPTNGLKRELYDRAEGEGVSDIIVSPSLHELDLPDNISKKINKFYDTGKHKSVVPYLKSVIKKNEAACVGELKKFLNERDEFYGSKGSTITTHKNFLHLDAKTLSKYDAAIIDEDIILKALIPDQCAIPLLKLERVLKKDKPFRALANKVKAALKAARTETFFELPPIEFNYEELEGISTVIDIPSFCLATRFFCSKASDENSLLENSTAGNLIFYRPIDLKAKIPTTIVSATIDEAIYGYVFGDVDFYKCKVAPYKGTLYQYPAYSMSRYFIDKNPDIFDRIVKLTGITDIITFLKYNKGPLHYGNTDGRDIYKGKDLNVIGTPHQPEWMYKLFAYTCGLDFDMDAKLVSNVIIDHNGYRFPFTTYEDEVLRNIQFYMIESELEQAVGRARLLRFGCAVHLFSNFPLRQAVMREVYY